MMASKSYFPLRPKVNPMIYAYKDSNPEYAGFLKIGYTLVDVEKRVAQQYPTKRPDGKAPYKIVYRESAMYSDGTSFTDHDVHRILKLKHVSRVGGEWFKCTVDDVKAAVIAVKTRSDNFENRTNNFSLRPEQADAVKKTIEYFKKSKESDSNQSPKFLWNAKMRFGKTFASYKLAQSMKFKRILVLTFKPAVEAAWEEDLMTHIDFEGWQFIKPHGLTYQKADKKKPIVCFGSFQDYLGVDRETGGIKAKNEWVHTTNWDLVIFDEYHFGAWRDNAKNLFVNENDDDFDLLDIEKYKETEADNAYNESFLPITSNHYLFLSGTPFRALNSGEFIEDQIFNWTYSDEQRAKESWTGTNNPYASLPRMVLMTYKVPESIRRIALQGEFNEFDLNVFFSAKGKAEDSEFIYETYVQKWLDLIRGSFFETTIDELKHGSQKPPMPFSDVRLLNVLSHTFWFLPNVSSCYAMSNLLKKRQNIFYRDYKIIVAAGSKAGIGVNALYPVQKTMDNPLETKTITLSCGKLTTGVTVKPWTGILMLRNLSSPETYFQAAFRVQSPWDLVLENGKREIIKKECYIFDFSLDRALKQIADYSCRLNINESNPEKKVGEFISFLPVLAYDGSSMKEVNAAEILDISLAGTSATLLARRWQSPLLVNVDNETLQRLLTSKKALEALMKIEDFKNLNTEIKAIINSSENVKKAKKDGTEKLNQDDKKKLSDEEKEYKSKRKIIRDKLIKFATRIPLFMYLTDYRERSLKDVIIQLEPELFKKVTGLNVPEFELLLSLGVFNAPLMNDAIYKFKRYEDASLNYSGINKHEGEKVGLFDTVIDQNDFSFMKNSPDLSNTKVELQKNTVEFGSSQNDASSNTDQIVIEYPKKISGEKVEKNSNDSPDSSVQSFSVDANAPLVSKTKLRYQSLKVGSIVLHYKFGKGVVSSMSKDKLLVNFDNGSKWFQYPKAFQQGHLEIIEL